MFKVNLSHEKELLLSCARTQIPEDSLYRNNDLISFPLNWKEIVDSALSCDIAPLVYHALKQMPQRQLIPQPVLDKLKANYHWNIARNMCLYSELQRILESFEYRGIQVIVLKGAALAKTVYGDIGLRPMQDIDLLVRRQDLRGSNETMYELGYFGGADILSTEGRMKNKHYHVPIYRHRNNKAVPVEIHWHITDKSWGVNIDKWWDRAGSMEIDGHSALVPSPEDMIVHLCLHSCNHGYRGGMLLKGLCDLSETLRHYELQLSRDLLVDTVHAYKIERPVYAFLYLTKTFFRERESSLGWITPDKVDQKLLKAMGNAFFAGDPHSAGVPGDLVRSLAADTLLKKVNMLLPKIFPSREAMSERYLIPAFSVRLIFYYVLRLFQLLAKYGKSAVDLYRMKSR